MAWGEKTHLSMNAIKGDIKPAAHAALVTSLPRRRGKFLVFHVVVLLAGRSLIVEGEDGDEE